MSKLVKFQRYLFYVFLVLLPILIFPLNLFAFSYGRAIITLVFSVFLLVTELIKLFNSGRISFFKSNLDLFLLLLGISFLLSGILSNDKTISFMGFDYRMGTGILVILVTILDSYILRGVFKKINEVIVLFQAFVLGTALSAFLSILNLFDLPDFKFISELYRNVNMNGVSVFRSNRIGLIIWALGLLVGFSLFVVNQKRKESSDNKKYYKYFNINLIVSFVLNYLAVAVFSLSVGLFVVIFTILMIVASVFIINMYLGKNIPKKAFLSFVIIPIVIFAMRLGLQLGGVEIDFLNKIGITLNTQVPIGLQDSWYISITSLSDSILSGLIGLGNDLFYVAYNLYQKPNLVYQNIGIGFHGYTEATNEILNVLVERGVLGLLVWFLGFYLVGFNLLKTLKITGQRKRVETLEVTDLLNLMSILSLVFILLSSFVVYYSFIMYFYLVLFLSLAIIVSNIKNDRMAESLVLELNLFVEKIQLMKSRELSFIFNMVIFVLGFIALYLIGKNVMTYTYVIRAENRIVSLQAEQSEEVSSEEVQKGLEEAILAYDNAIQRQPNNYVLYRESSILVTQYTMLLAQNISEDDKEAQKQMDLITNYGAGAQRYSDKAVQLSPILFSNWITRSYVYSTLFNLDSRSSDLLNSNVKILQQALTLNPNYAEGYYDLASFYVVGGELDTALQLLNQALNVNSLHFKSYLLAGQIYMKNGRENEAKVYIDRVLNILEQLGRKDSELYRAIENYEYTTEVDQFITDQSKQEEVDEVQNEILEEEIDLDNTGEEVLDEILEEDETSEEDISTDETERSTRE